MLFLKRAFRNTFKILSTVSASLASCEVIRNKLHTLLVKMLQHVIKTFKKHSEKLVSRKASLLHLVQKKFARSPNVPLRVVKAN